MAKYQIIAATGCPTGVAHTFMAQEALEKAAKERGIRIKVETHGQGGIENELSPQEIAEADGVIIAADKDVDIDRFDGKRVLNVSVGRGMKEADLLLDQILNDPNIPIHHATEASRTQSGAHTSDSPSFLRNIYVSLMNGVSHMLPLVVAGGVLIAISFFWGINSADPKSPEFNSFAALLMKIGGFAMNLMVPVLCAYIAEAIAKRSGLIVGFATGMIAYTNGTGFLGGIVGGFLAGYVIKGLQRVFANLPKSLNGLKQIFLFPVFGVFISGAIMWYLSHPMQSINEGMMVFLKSMENSNPILLGIIVGIMCAADMGGPINKAAYLTGTALLAQGNYYFMAGVSAACIAPPLATGFAVLFNKKAYSADERSAGYVNFLLGSTHITEGAIPFAAKNPLLNLPSFMLGSAIAATLSYIFHISVPAPHGGFIVLPLVNKPFLWVLSILVGAVVAGALLAAIAGRQQKRQANVSGDDLDKKDQLDNKVSHDMPSGLTSGMEDILTLEQIQVDVDLKTKEDVLSYLATFGGKLGLVNDPIAVAQKYKEREAQGSTGMEKGLAIPHAQDKSIKRSAMLIIKLTHPVDWPSFDGNLVDTIISFLIPAEGGDHLRYLSQTSKLLMHEDFVHQLKEAKDPKRIYDLFTQGNKER
ncbi:PTS fructose transporter subunit IIABC [Atopobacter sp. AH10]|uniref:fructose-specific PTS transporter subunit EIIC n=1 Tax=Atopobacter sp. AH10 TaxID=2315861 RepID=UPI000EF25868|nr:fructose-specific PTS transporter subunit EIIC [Atopobacter sp. AH10]RLK63663.1 PTS fructose transporter subunit IIABC [Atopobacter sp. AH10]